MILIRAKLGRTCTTSPVIFLLQFFCEGKLLALVESFIAVFIELVKGSHVSLTVFFLMMMSRRRVVHGADFPISMLSVILPRI